MIALIFPLLLALIIVGQVVEGVSGLSPELLTAFVVALISFGLEMIPKVKEWHDKLSSAGRRWVQVVVVVLVSAALYGMSCGGFLGVVLPGIIVTCDVSGLSALGQIALLAAIGFISSVTSYTLNNPAHK